MPDARRSIVLRADDFGMHPAVDAGIIAAHAAGAIDEAAFFAIGPSADTAARSAIDLRMAISLHIAYSCDWDVWRWGSLTGRIEGSDGALPLHPADLATTPLADLVAEARAQLDRARALGLDPASFNFHIDAPRADLPAVLQRELDLPCRDIALGCRPAPGWYDSFLDLSSLPDPIKLTALIDYIATAGAGRHCIVAHPGLNRNELAQLCSAALPGRQQWACDFRLSDGQLLTDRESIRRIRYAMTR